MSQVVTISQNVRRPCRRPNQLTTTRRQKYHEARHAFLLQRMSSVSDSILGSRSHSCLIERLPNELLSEILIAACEAGEAFHTRFTFPLIPMLVSKRFRAISLWTHDLWRYLLIRDSISDHIRGRVGRSGVVALDVEVSLSGLTLEVEGLPGFLLTVVSRLGRLVIKPYCDTSRWAREMLELGMPQLEELELVGYLDDELVQFSSLLFPKLKSLRSVGIIQWWNSEAQLANTVHTLVLKRPSLCHQICQDPVAELRRFLPPTLRSLNIGCYDLPQGDYEADYSPLHMPNLTKLSMKQICSWDHLYLLQRIKSPTLSTLKLSVDLPPSGPGGMQLALCLDFPALDEVKLEILDDHPPLISLLYACSSITTLIIKTLRPLSGVRDFVEWLSKNPLDLPILEELEVYGASMTHLRKAAQDRPLLANVTIYTLDLGLTSLATREEFAEWEEATDWITTELHVNLEDLMGDTFYADRMKRYRSWEDMMKGIYVSQQWWRGHDIDDVPFWANYWAERCTESQVDSRAELRRIAARGQAYIFFDEPLEELEALMEILPQANFDSTIAPSVA